MPEEKKVKMVLLNLWIKFQYQEDLEDFVKNNQSTKGGINQILWFEND